MLKYKNINKIFIIFKICLNSNKVENKKKLAFFVTKASDGQPIDFEPIEKPNDKHVIYFNYDTIIDFSIGVKSIDKNDQIDIVDDLKDEETLNAEIECRNKFILLYNNNYSLFFLNFLSICDK